MKTLTNEKLKLTFGDFIILASILSVGYGNIKGYAITQYFILFSFAYFVYKFFITSPMIKINKKKLLYFSLTIVYILLITLLFNPNFIDMLSGLTYLIISLITFFLYSRFTKKRKIIYLLYQISFFISILGIFQEVIFLFNEDLISNSLFSVIYSKNSIIQLGTELVRVSSIYAEPAHLAPIFSISVAIIIEKFICIDSSQFFYVNKVKNIIIFICIILTFSLVVYITICIVIFIYYLLIYDKKKKISFILFWFIIPTLIIYLAAPKILTTWLYEKFITQLFLGNEMTTNNLTGFALISNFRIAIEKLKDGYILGTGFESHSIYYWKYIDRLYSSVYLNLNVVGAGSVYIRIFSEFGIIGVIFMMFLIVKQFIIAKRNFSNFNDYTIIHRIALIGLTVYCLRNGSYVHPFFMLMVGILLNSKRNINKQRRKSMVTVINYANESFKKAQKINTKSAYRIGQADKVIEYSPKEIDNKFVVKYKNILSEKKGNGFWLWKPYFLNKTLNECLDYGEYIFYVDSGSYFVNKIDLLIQAMEKANTDIMLFELPLIERQFTKRDTMVLMDCDIENVVNTNQAMGGFILLKKTNNSIKFVQDFLNYSCNEDLLKDDVKLHDNYNDFEAHRHDQSILSCLSKKWGIILFRDPTQYGDRPLEYAKAGRFILLKKYYNSEYPRILESCRREPAFYLKRRELIISILNKFKLDLLRKT